MFARILRKIFPWKEIGWHEIGEVFYRYTLFKCPWFSIRLHQLTAPNWPPQCHDHPWWFVTLILRGGYLEEHQNSITWQRPGKVLYRPAKFRHNVVTPCGTAWSLLIMGPTSRKWGMVDCLRRA
jgi:hypothetical protein